MNTRQINFEKVLSDLNKYIANLYKKDLNKFKSRILYLVQLHQTILDIVDPDSKDPKSIKDLYALCAKQEAKFRGKGGRQEYSKLLGKLRELCSADDKAKPDLVAAYEKFESETGEMLDKLYTGMLSKTKEYLKTLSEEIEQSKKGGFFTIDRPLSEEKHKIATRLKKSLKAFTNEPSRDTYNALLMTILECDDDHKKALQGKVGKGQRLNKLIFDLKEIAKQHSTTDYYIVADVHADLKKQKLNSSPNPNLNEKD